MRLGVVAAALIGLLGAAYLIFYIGFDAVLQAVISVGWSGFALLCLYGAANFVLLGIAWLVIVPPFNWRNAATFCWGRAVRDSAGEILPFSQVGGALIGVRATILRGVAQGTAVASTVVDLTMEMIAQIVFTVAGLIILTMHLGANASLQPLLQTAIIGVIVAMLAAAAFFIVQRRGFPLLERLAERFVPAAALHAAAVGQAISRIHDAPWRMAASFAIHCIGWLSSAFGTWLALRLIATPISFSDAVAIESVLCAARSAAIFVPGAIGVQEAGYAAMMPLFGLPPQIGLAISLLKRAREIALGVPILLGWQIAEGRHAVFAKTKTLAKSE